MAVWQCRLTLQTIHIWQLPTATAAGESRRLQHLRWHGEFSSPEPAPAHEAADPSVESVVRVCLAWTRLTSSWSLAGRGPLPILVPQPHANSVTADLSNEGSAFLP